MFNAPALGLGLGLGLEDLPNVFKAHTWSGYIRIFRIYIYVAGFYLEKKLFFTRVTRGASLSQGA